MLSAEAAATLFDNALKCDVQGSEIHGYGLFARETIQEGEAVIDFSFPNFYREIRFEDQTDEFLQEGKFIGMSEEICLVGERATKFAVVNHSRTPNAAIHYGDRKVYALTKIQPNEEITIDYRLEPVSPRTKQLIQNWL